MRYRRPDQKNAQSIFEEAERVMRYTLTLPVTEEASSTIVRNIYECFRMLGDAIVTNEGREAIDHIEQIQALMKLKAETRRPLSAIDNLRRLRHNVNYYGYHPTMSETQDVLDLANACFQPLADEVRRILEKK